MLHKYSLKLCERPTYKMSLCTTIPNGIRINNIFQILRIRYKINGRVVYTNYNIQINTDMDNVWNKRQSESSVFYRNTPSYASSSLVVRDSLLMFGVS
jgi:hypothetical protein